MSKSNASEHSISDLAALSEGSARSLAPAVERAIKVLELLAATPQQGLTVSQISRSLGIPKSTTFNICAVMVEGKILRRKGQGFQLGRKLVELGSSYVAGVDLVREFYEACSPVPVDLNAIIQLAVLEEHHDTVFLAKQDCNSGIRLGLGGGIGRRLPTNCTACGKALLSLMPQNTLEQIYRGMEKLSSMTANSLSDPERLLQEIAQIRANNHYAVDNEEAVVGLRCIAKAFPTDHAEGGMAAISVSASTHDLTEQRKMQIQEALDEVVARLTSHI